MVFDPGLESALELSSESSNGLTRDSSVSSSVGSSGGFSVDSFRTRWLRPFPLKRRSALGLGIGVGAMTLAGAAVYLYASRVEAKALRLERLKLVVGNAESGYKITESRVLSTARSANASAVSVASAKGAASRQSNSETRTLKILHISDLHLSAPETGKIDFLQRITAEDGIDLVVLTGDIFQNPSGFQYATKILSKMPRLGAYAVLGNHDYFAYSMINKIIGRLYRPWRHPDARLDVTLHFEALEFGGFQVVHNDIVRFAHEGFSIIGIDYFGIDQKVLNSLAASVPENHLLFGLFHVPKKLHRMTEAGFDIAFGGHTHGGQIRVPGVGALITDSELKRKEASGIIRRGRTVFHISRGMGADPRSNFRLFCPPAATMLKIEYDLS